MGDIFADPTTYTILGVISSLSMSWAITKKAAIDNSAEIEKINKRLTREDGRTTYITREELEDIRRPVMMHDGRSVFVTRPEHDDVSARVKSLENLLVGCDGRSAFITRPDCETSTGRILDTVNEIYRKVASTEEKRQAARGEEMEIIAGLRSDIRAITDEITRLRKGALSS